MSYTVLIFSNIYCSEKFTVLTECQPENCSLQKIAVCQLTHVSLKSVQSIVQSIPDFWHSFGLTCTILHLAIRDEVLAPVFQILNRYNSDVT